MSVGVLGRSGFGAADSDFAKYGAGVRGTETPCKEPRAIPWQCWDKPGFKECHAIAFKAAQGECEFRGRKDDVCCIKAITSAVVEETCAQECPELLQEEEGSSLLPAVLIGIAIVAGLALIGGKA